MKKVLFGGFLLLMATNTFGQNEKPDSAIASVFGNGNLEIEWRSVFSLSYHQKISNIKPGIALEATLNKYLIVGVFGQFTSGNFSMPYRNYQNNIITQDFGLILGATQNADRLFYCGGQIRIGAIFLQADSSSEIKLLRSFTPTARDQGITVYPEINANINLSKRITWRTGTGFNFLMLKKETIVNERVLDTWFLNSALLFRF